LPVTRYIIKLAPKIPGWELHPARPAKRGWKLQVTVEGDREVTYDATPWRYVLYEFEDGTFDIVVEQNNVGTEPVSYVAAVIIVDGFLGEEVRIELFGEIEPVNELSEEQTPKATSITKLADHVQSILRARN
jgi:hypothetical protein